MRAAVLRKLPTETLDVSEVETPSELAADELLIEVAACGICGTDVHILAGSSYRPELPFVTGHEPVGTVVAAGSAGLSDWLGRRVTQTLFTGCGECPTCRDGNGDERLCPNLRAATGVLGQWGGFAEYLRVRAAQVVEAPKSLADDAVATLVDAGATALNAVRTVLARKRERVIVVGAGPVGFVIAEALRTEGLLPLVVEPNPRRRAAVAAAGHQTAASLEEAQEESPDCVVDGAGASQVPGWALSALGPRGLLVAVGYTIVPELDLAPIARKELSIRGVRSGSRADLSRALDLAARGAIRLPSVATWPLDRINEAFAALRAGRVEGKAVVTVAS